jgi:hypothetical protein
LSVRAGLDMVVVKTEKSLHYPCQESDASCLALGWTIVSAVIFTHTIHYYCKTRCQLNSEGICVLARNTHQLRLHGNSLCSESSSGLCHWVLLPYMAPQPRRPYLETSPLWKPQNLNLCFADVHSLCSVSDVKTGPYCAPSILITFINMVLFKENSTPSVCDKYMYNGQVSDCVVLWRRVKK